MLPQGAHRTTLETRRGSFAAFEIAAEPAPGAAAEAGERGTALLVPGFTGSKEDFIAILRPLATRGFRVVTYDQRGQFETPGPAGPEGWSLEAFGQDVLAVVEAVGGPVHLLGHSFGGLVVRQALLADPAAARSLVLLCTGPAALDGDRPGLLNLMADGVESVGLAQVRAITRAMDLENGWVPHPDPAVEAFLDRRFLANDPASLAAMARILASATDRTSELAQLDLSILVACGEDDDAWSPKIQEETASQLGARFVSLPEAAHSPAAESPEATARLLAGFWDSVEAGVAFPS